MNTKPLLRALVALAAFAGLLGAGTLGRVVPIGGQGADLALDEARGVLYVANFTANRIEVMSLATQRIQTSINVSSQPSSLALSPDGKYLVIAHYGNFAPPASSGNALTVLELDMVLPCIAGPEGRGQVPMMWRAPRRRPPARRFVRDADGPPSGLVRG